jgi:hypothetical protein
MALASVLNVAAQARGKATETETTPQQALWAALPPLLFGLALSAFLLGFVPWREVVWGGPTEYPTPSPSFAPLVVPAIVGLALLCGGLLGAGRRLPRWSYTWASGAVVVVLFALVLLGDDLPYLISPTIDMWLVLSLLALLGAITLIAAWRGVSDAGLVGLGMGGTFTTAVLFFASASPFSRLDVSLLAMPAGLVMAGLILAYLLGGVTLKRAAVAITALLAVAAIWGYRGVILAVIPGVDPSFHWKLWAMAWAGLLGPPLLAWLLELRRPVGVG